MPPAGAGGVQGGVIRYVFVSIILIAVMGYVTNIMVGAMGTENDTLGVFTTIAQYGPMIVTILFVSLLVVVIAGILSYLGRI